MDGEYHSRYMGCNIYYANENSAGIKYVAYYEDGMYSYSLIPLRAQTLKGVKELIKSKTEYFQRRSDEAYKNICKVCHYGLNTDYHKGSCNGSI